MEDAKIQDASDNDLTNMPAPPEVDTTESNDMMEANTPTFESTDEPESKEAPIPEATPAPPTATNRERPSRTRKQVQSYVPLMTGKSYQYAATQIAYKEMLQHVPSEVVELILTQLTLKAAIKLWGKRATVAAEAEMKQLHWRNSFKPVQWDELTNVQRKAILESHIFLTEKRTGEIKGLTVAGGNKQRGFIEKEDASSPTVFTESVILTSVVDALERRANAIIDVPNAFIQTFVEDKSKRVIIRIEGCL